MYTSNLSAVCRLQSCSVSPPIGKMESPYLSSSTSSLNDVDSLKALLAEKEELLRQAGQYGISLMEDNKELSRNFDAAERKYTKNLEVCTLQALHSAGYTLCRLCTLRALRSAGYTHLSIL